VHCWAETQRRSGRTSAQIMLTWVVDSDVRAVDRDTLGPILFLLENSDIEVQRAASAALGNLAVNSRSPRGYGLSWSCLLTQTQPTTRS
jgi:hypothetical protein